MMSMQPCPPDYHPGCQCSVQGLEPADDCPVHGFSDPRVCPYCGQMRGYSTPCKRCGCTFGLVKEMAASEVGS